MTPCCPLCAFERTKIGQRTRDSFARIVVAFHQGTVGSLPVHQGAITPYYFSSSLFSSTPIRTPVEGECSRGSIRWERTAVTAGQLLSSDVHPKYSSEILVVVGSVDSTTGIGGIGTTLQASIDDHDCGSKSRFQIGSRVSCVGCPCPFNHLQHARLWSLRSHIEPHTAGEIQPGGSYEIRIFQKDTGISVHGLRECPVVVVPAQLFCPPSMIHLPRSTGEGSSHPIRPSVTVCTPGVDLFKVEQACSFLFEVGKHICENLRTVGCILAYSRVHADCSQEVGVCVGCVLIWEELIKF